MAHPVFKTGRAVQPTAWMVRFHRRSVGARIGLWRTVTYVKVRDIVKVLDADGWVQVRQTGSHRHFRHPIKRGTVTVAGHQRHDLHPKTQKSILRQAGLIRD